MAEEDARVQAVREERPICGVTTTHLSIERICINEPHGTTYQRKSRPGTADDTGAHPERRPLVQAPPADRHYFVRRWPYR